jgi:fucose 4-O-acetylase-like acetyltransferase
VEPKSGSERSDYPATNGVDGRFGRALWIDALRGLAVFLVVFEHAAVLIPGGAPHPLAVSVAALAPFRMPVLMFLSGMLLSRSLAKPRATFLRGKVSRILWPYLLWSVIFLLLAVPGEPPPNALDELLLNPTYPTWYIGYLFLFYMLSLMLPARARSAAIAVCLLAAAMVDQLSAAHIVGSVMHFQVERLLFTLAMFFSGDFFVRHSQRIMQLLTRIPVVATCLLLASATGVASSLGFRVQWNALWVVPVFAGILASIRFAPRLAGSRVGQAFATMGRQSIVFYLLHWPTQIVTFHLLFALSIRDPTVVFITNFVAGILAPMVFLQLKKRFGVLAYLFDLDPPSGFGWSPTLRKISAARWRRPRPS